MESRHYNIFCTTNNKRSNIMAASGNAQCIVQKERGRGAPSLRGYSTTREEGEGNQIRRRRCHFQGKSDGIADFLRLTLLLLPLPLTEESFSSSSSSSLTSREAEREEEEGGQIGRSDPRREERTFFFVKGSCCSNRRHHHRHHHRQQQQQRPP